MKIRYKNEKSSYLEKQTNAVLKRSILIYINLDRLTQTDKTNTFNHREKLVFQQTQYKYNILYYENSLKGWHSVLKTTFSKSIVEVGLNNKYKYFNVSAGKKLSVH